MRRTAAALLSLLVLSLFLLPLRACGKIAAVSVSGGGDEAAALENALAALLGGDGDAYFSAFPPRMGEDYREQGVCAYHFGFADADEWLESVRDAYGENYGGGLRIKGRLVSVTETAVSALEDRDPDYYTRERYVTEENTERALEAVFEYEIKGEKYGETKEALICFVEQGGKWYLHPCLAFFTF